MSGVECLECALPGRVKRPVRGCGGKGLLDEGGHALVMGSDGKVISGDKMRTDI